MPRVSSQKTRQALLVVGDPLDSSTLPEKLQLFNEAGEPIALEGSRIYADEGEPDTELGKLGDFYIDKTDRSFYEKTGPETWTLFAELGIDEAALHFKGNYDVATQYEANDLVAHNGLMWRATGAILGSEPTADLGAALTTIRLVRVYAADRIHAPKLYTIDAASDVTNIVAGKKAKALVLDKTNTDTVVVTVTNHHPTSRLMAPLFYAGSVFINEALGATGIAPGATATFSVSAIDDRYPVFYFSTSDAGTFTVSAEALDDLVAPPAESWVIFGAPPFVPVYFSAIKVANQSVTNAEPLCTYTSEDLDSHGAFASSVFTAPLPGIYEFHASLVWAAASDAAGISALQLYKNTKTVRLGAGQVPGSSAIGIASYASCIVALAQGDTVAAYAYSATTRNTKSPDAIDGAASRFWGRRIA